MTDGPNATASTNTTDGTIPGLLVPGGNPDSDQVNCSDLVTGRKNDCWLELGLTEYLREWLADATCYEGEGFAGCFMRQNHFPGLDCTQITPNSCPAIQSDEVNKDPRTFYIAYNIYGRSSEDPFHYNLC